MAAEPFERAFAKVNLTLHVTGRRADGYHLLDSLVVFANVADVVSLGGEAPLTVSGTFADVLVGDNLVLRAAGLMGFDGPIRLEKNLPVASGLGGGSADAAATLRLLARVLGRQLPDTLALGADVPVCLTPKPQRMRGIGELVELVEVPDFWLVLVNPGVRVKTASIFGTLKTRDNAGMEPFYWEGFAGFIAFLRRQRNDLQHAAIAIVPVISDVLAALAGQKHCELARMSGSGATCFGVFERQKDAELAAELISSKQPSWWVRAVRRV